MTCYTDLIVGLSREASGKVSVTVPDSWMQGRTTYGGLTAALCFEAAKSLAGDKPLRSAQIAFVGPVGGTVEVQPTLLRMGKNSAFVSADLFGDTGDLAARATFTFGKGRDGSHTLNVAPSLPDVPAPDTLQSFFGGGLAPGFTRNFEMQLAFGPRPLSGSDSADIGLWLRHADRNAPDDMTAILAIGDAPPPAAFSLFKGPARISSMTWALDVLTDRPNTQDGWWFARHTAETLQDGYSTQAMTLWNRSGQPMIIGRQTIAMFG